MSERIEYKEAADFLKEHDNYYILIHSNPDGDAVGSGYALCFILREIGKKANVLCSDPIPSKYSYITDNYEPQKFTHDTVVSTDLADINLLGKKLDPYADYIELAIDHHISNAGYAKRLALDSMASSACEVLYDIVKAGELPVTELIAASIYTGIATDTGSFKYECTTPRCHEIAAELMREFKLPIAHMNRVLFEIKTEERFKLEQKVISDLQTFLDGKCAIIVISLDDIERTGATFEDLEGVATIPMQVKGVEVGVTIKEKEPKKYKVSMRSAEEIDVSKLCRKFGGGGHIRAAGCTIEGDIDQVRMKILSALAAEMGIDLWLA
ncbi:MAG: bifunctional oligoribonuclease/PAP phosphatase NrnA [Oscillospiraceae bacterium]|nr:bifunctional oligoribonuclease/PAP phosphatase NrnA [Oscillospiraceae bacterium]